MIQLLNNVTAEVARYLTTEYFNSTTLTSVNNQVKLAPGVALYLEPQ